MKRLALIITLTISLQVNAQSVFGFWYGYANVKTKNSANNYLIELILQPEKNNVKGILNYYFRNTYRSVWVKGNYDNNSRQLNLYDIPITYFGSITNKEIDCIMTMKATLKVAKAESTLSGVFASTPDNKALCPDISFNLSRDPEMSKQDSVLKAIIEFKETYQFWKPGIADTLARVKVVVVPDKVINNESEQEFNKRKNVVAQEIEVNSDSLRIDVYDNGEVDGDMISLFYNQQLILNKQMITHKSVRLSLILDKTKEVNELSMFAENLGLIPPNTALMIINDGQNRYEVRLSSDLGKNSTIKIKRKQ